jgi:hypothetical protein
MRKHNKLFASRFSRQHGDRTNFPQSMSHSIANNKGFHLNANALLMALLKGIK